MVRHHKGDSPGRRTVYTSFSLRVLVNDETKEETQRCVFYLEVFIGMHCQDARVSTWHRVLSTWFDNGVYMSQMHLCFKKKKQRLSSLLHFHSLRGFAKDRERAKITAAEVKRFWLCFKTLKTTLPVMQLCGAFCWTLLAFWFGLPVEVKIPW